MEQQTNPLAQHFRQAALYIPLPSGGQYWPDGALNLGATGELGIFPMTAKDEITLKTPDALLNGSAVIEVIQSCVPGIIDPWATPSIDIDNILIAIRIASYGEMMDVTSTCPHCKEKNDFQTDLRTLLDQPRHPDFDTPIEANGMAISLRPYNYRHINKQNLRNFEEQRALAIVQNSEMSDEDKLEQFSVSLKKLTKYTVEAITAAVSKITLADGTVVDNKAFLDEYFENCDRKVFQKVKDRLDEIAESIKIPPLEGECTECHKVYKTELEFDQANFFA